MNAGGISAKGRELAKQNREEFRKNRNKKKFKTQNFLDGDNRYLSYPIARNNDENTGDTLRIKCIEYQPSNGEDFQVRVENFYGVKVKDGKPTGDSFIPTKEQRDANGFPPVEINPTFVNADTLSLIHI